MKNVPGKMICFKEVRQNKIKWYFIKNNWTLQEMHTIIIPKIRQDFGINNIVIAAAGIDNEVENFNPDQVPCLLEDFYESDTMEEIWGEELDVSFYVRNRR